MRMQMHLSMLLIAVVLLNTDTAKSALIHWSNGSNPVNRDKCVDDVTKIAYNFGDTWYNNAQCIMHVCQKGEYNTPIKQTHRCWKPTAKPPCSIIRNPGTSYPQCCPVLSCPGPSFQG